tara:strand:+ start:24888 stop:25667 length:780 start_codon:yes stop_codon:yes gene_type:complete
MPNHEASGQNEPGLNLIILAHPRSGSTTLRRAFDAHPAINILNEPFNPTRGPGGWGHDYLADLNKTGDLPAMLRQFSENHNGVKHLLGQLSREQDIEMLRRYSDRFFLTRRNQLQSVVSCLVAAQTKQWHRHGKVPQVANAELRPLDIDHVSRYLNWQIDFVQEVRETIEKEQLGCQQVYYEDLFDKNIPLPRRMEIIVQLLRPIVGGGFTEEFYRDLAEKLDHNANKVNSEHTYTLLPNAKEIDAEFGSAETGYLFDS